MIDPPPKAEWVIHALKDEGLPILLCGCGALLLQGEYTGTVDMDVLVGSDFAGALAVLDAYVDRGDLFPSGALPGEVAQYLVSGQKPVDVIDVSSVHADLFHLLRTEASKRIERGAAGPVDVVTREGYFVLAIMIGSRGFASSRKADPMRKVREAGGSSGNGRTRAR